MSAVPEALAAYEKSLDISRRLAKADPSDIRSQRTLSISYEKLGDLSLQIGVVPNAVNYYQKCHEIRMHLVKVDPTDTQAQRDLAFSFGKRR